MRSGNCGLCGKPLDQAELARYCLECAIKRRERQRMKSGSRRRYNSASYRISARINGASGLEDSLTSDRTPGDKPPKKKSVFRGDGPTVTLLGNFELSDRIAKPNAQNLAKQLKRSANEATKFARANNFLEQVS
jgi:hypothetical protein